MYGSISDGLLLVSTRSAASYYSLARENERQSPLPVILTYLLDSRDFISSSSFFSETAWSRFATSSTWETEKPNLLTFILLQIERSSRSSLAVQVSTEEIHQSLDNVFVVYIASFDIRSASGEAKTRRGAVEAASYFHCARFPGIETTGTHFVWRFRYFVIWKERVRIRKTLDISQDFPRGKYNLIEVLSAKKVRTVKL